MQHYCTLANQGVTYWTLVYGITSYWISDVLNNIKNSAGFYPVQKDFLTLGCLKPATHAVDAPHHLNELMIREAL